MAPSRYKLPYRAFEASTASQTSSQGTTQDDTVELNWILFDKSRHCVPAVISIPQGLYERPSQYCRSLFIEPLRKECDVDTEAECITFWTPKEPISIEMAAAEGWATSLDNFEAHFTSVLLPTPLSRRIVVADDERVHLVIAIRKRDRKRPLDDHSHIVGSRQSKRRKRCLPDIAELVAVLKEPLSDSEKIPLSEEMYSSLICKVPPDKCDEDIIETLFKVGKFDPSLSDFFAAVARSSPVEGTDKAFISFWDDNIRRLIELLLPTGKSIRNNNQRTETRQLRPDYGFLLRDICLFRGEETVPGAGNSGDPKAELADKLNWVYDPAPYMFGYHCRGSEVTLAAITAPTSPGGKPNVHDLIRLDLRWRAARISNLRHLVNFSSILPQLADLVRSPVDDFQRFEQTNSTVEITSTLVVKTFTCPNAEARVELLRQTYEMIEKWRIPNTDKLAYAKRNVVHLSPRGIAGQPLVEKELRECVICILESLIVAHQVPIYHRDVRWDNVIRRIDDHSKWFLIDWEDAGQPPTKAQLSFSRSNHSPAIFEDGHGADVDVWGVGNLIKTCRAADLSAEFKALGDRICQESQTLSADAALKLIKLSNYVPYTDQPPNDT